MTNATENEYLCRVGPGTPMGNMMRRFWHPVCTTGQLAEPGGKPLRVTLLGEKLVAFRDTKGKVGVLGEFCMHRRASLALGRVEDCGLRCIYHGWKFGADGEVLDIMNHPDPNYRKRMRQKAYPVEEAGGIVWAYMGAQQHRPPLPRFPFLELPETHRHAIRVNISCNYLQTVEGGLDSSHVGILHSDIARAAWNSGEGAGLLQSNDTAPRLEIEDTEFGYHYAAIRIAEERSALENVRIVPFIMPYIRIIPGTKNSTAVSMVFEVPADDTHTSTFIVAYDPAQAINVAATYRILGIDDEKIYDRERCSLNLNWDNGLQQDRSSMSSSWTGLRGIEIEDAVVALSMPPISDRENENLVPADAAIVRMRRRLLESARRVERGEDPLGLSADASRFTAIDADLPHGKHWRTLVPGHVTDVAVA